MIDEKSLLKELCKGNAISGLGLDVNTWMMLYMRLSKMINNHPKVGEWIPCSERLPEDMQMCLVTQKILFITSHCDNTDTCICIKINTYSEKYGWLDGVNVFAWMPLPEPYKE